MYIFQGNSQTRCRWREVGTGSPVDHGCWSSPWLHLEETLLIFCWDVHPFNLEKHRFILVHFPMFGSMLLQFARFDVWFRQAFLERMVTQLEGYLVKVKDTWLKSSHFCCEERQKHKNKHFQESRAALKNRCLKLLPFEAISGKATTLDICRNPCAQNTDWTFNNSHKCHPESRSGFLKLVCCGWCLCLFVMLEAVEIQ